MHRFLMATGLVGLASLCLPTPAQAVLTVEFRSGTSLVGAPLLTVVDNTGNDTNVRFGNISVDPDALGALFPGLSFVDIGASANNVNPTTGAVNPVPFARVTTGGEVQRLEAAAGGTATTLRIRASQNDFSTTSPTTQGTLETGATYLGTFTDADDILTYVGAYADSNVLFSEEQPTAPIILAGTGANTDVATGKRQRVVAGSNPFSITNDNLIQIGPSPGLERGIRPTIQFQSSSLVFAGNPIPEPSTIAMVVAGVPVLGLGLWRRRKARA